MRYTYRHTLMASYLGYITQAIVVNLASLLFVTFQTTFALSLEKIGLLISINFGVQILTDLIAARVIDRVGFRVPVVLAHVLAALGLILMSVLPGLIEPYAALVLATVCMAIGGGLTEVLISPIVEALPGDAKASAMSLLHSFYSWGQVAVVLLSTAFFAIFGLSHWRWLPILWALIPLFNIFFFGKVPLRQLVEESQRQPVRKLFSTGVFWLLLLLMVCGGAAEQAMAQWSSLFAEVGLGVSKSVGDLLGPCSFALLMGVARLLYGIYGDRIKLDRVLMLSAVFGVVSYLLAVFAPTPLLSLLGCALTGLAVGIMWPGVLSLSSSICPFGGAAMFAVLALAGDTGCSVGPALVGWLSTAVESGALAFSTSLFGLTDLTQAGLHMGLFAAILFPIGMIVGVAALIRARRKRELT